MALGRTFWLDRCGELLENVPKEPRPRGIPELSISIPPNTLIYIHSHRNLRAIPHDAFTNKDYHFFKKLY